MELINKVDNRNVAIDALKGLGILLMVIGHSNLPFNLRGLIFVFHMPLFFMVSGYLYKERSYAEILNKQIARIMVPFFFTGIVIWIGKLKKGFPDWGISLILGNGSRPVFDNAVLEKYSIGPLWYLLAFSWTILFFRLLIRVNSNIWKVVIAIILFELSLVFCASFGPLPLDILQAIPATLFMLAGFWYQKHEAHRFHNKWIFYLISLSLLLICYRYGTLSMASHVYKLNIVQVMAAIGITYVLYDVIRKHSGAQLVKLVGVIGRYTLPILCFHAIDYNLHISSYCANVVLHGIRYTFIPKILISLLFSFGMTYICSYNPLICRIFSIKK